MTMKASRTTLALVFATTAAFVVACSGEAAAPSPTTTSAGSRSAGSEQSAESLGTAARIGGT